MCPADASVAVCFAVHSRKHWTTFTSFSWLSCVMKDRVFRCSVRHFSASSSELRPFVSGLPINSQGLWTYAFRLKDSVNNNNNNFGINRDDVALVKSGKFKDCVLSWMFGRKTVASPVYKYWVLRPVCFLRSRSLLCEWTMLWCTGAASLCQ